jgi:hypothetical protein
MLDGFQYDNDNANGWEIGLFVVTDRLLDANVVDGR